MRNSTLKMTLWATILGLFFYLPSMAQTAVIDSVSSVIGITSTTAFTGSWVNDMNAVYTERGVCYSTSENPTIADSIVPSFKVSPIVPFEPAYLKGLKPNTTYYVRAYGKNDTGVVYSDQKSFTTANNNAEVLWKLSGATGFDAAVTGAVSADPMSIADTTHISGWDKNNGKDVSIGSDYLKIQPAGNGGASFDSLVYFGFNVSPKTDVNFTVKKLNMVCAGYKTSGATLAFAYSLDDFATEDSLGVATLDDKALTQSRGTVLDPVKPGSGSPNDETGELGGMYISFSTNIEVPAGKTLSIRMYAWGKNSITLLMKDVIISGEASTSLAAGTAVIDSVSTVIGITNTTAFTGSWVNDMTAALTESGVCYSTSENPTILDNSVPSFKVSAIVPFEPVYLKGLKPNTTYYVRAYGKNASGISYSAQKSFTTADNGAEVLWQLSNFRQFAAVVTGDITAEAMSTDTALTVVSGWDKNNGKSVSIGSDYLKIQPQGGSAGASFNADSYFGFNIKPKAETKYTVKKLNMVCAGYKSSGATLAFAYSLDGFATQDSLGVATLDDKALTQSRGTVLDPVKPGSGSPNDETGELGGMYISFSTNIEVPAGDSLSIRMYAWGKDGITLLMKDVIISGETVTIPTSIRTTNATQSLKVYPTLARQNIRVEATSRIDAIKIVSIDGRVMKIVTPNAQSDIIDVSNFSNGIYMVVVKTATGINARKIIVSK